MENTEETSERTRPAHRAMIALQAIQYMLSISELVATEMKFVRSKMPAEMVPMLTDWEKLIRDIEKRVVDIANDFGDQLDGCDVLGHDVSDHVLSAMFDVLNNRIDADGNVKQVP